MVRRLVGVGPVLKYNNLYNLIMNIFSIKKNFIFLKIKKYYYYINFTMKNSNKYVFNKNMTLKYAQNLQ